MSYLKSMQQNMARAGLANNKSEYVGPLDILIVSPESKEPWFLYFLKTQVTKDGAFAPMKKFIKEYRRAGSSSRWAFTFDRKDRWHSVRPVALHPPCTQPPTSQQRPSLSLDVPLPAWQIDSEGIPNDLTLGEFLNDEETKAVFRDRECVKTLSYKASLLGGLITKAEAIANSENWVPAGVGEEAESDGDEPPSSADAFPQCVAGPSSPPKSTEPPEPPATLSGGKRKSRGPGA